MPRNPHAVGARNRRNLTASKQRPSPAPGEVTVEPGAMPGWFLVIIGRGTYAKRLTVSRAEMEKLIPAFTEALSI